MESSLPPAKLAAGAKKAAGAAALLAVALLGWWLLRPTPPAPEPLPAVVRASAEREPAAKAPPPAPVEQADFLPDGQQIYPAGSVAPPEPQGMAPHGLTPRHQRIYRENNLVGSLNGAMDVGDVAGLRRLLQQYREEFPEDSHVLQVGYELIANCLEHPRSSRHREIAQRYYEEELNSGLRRYIRRHCLAN